MSSDSNGRKQDSPDPGSATGTGPRSSPWGAARDALAGLHNLVALLRNPSVSQPTLVELVPELRSSAKVLRSAFAPTPESDGTAADVAEGAAQHIDRLDQLLDRIEAGGERDEEATQLASVAEELEALAELLALLERAASPVPTEVTLDLVASEAGRVSGSARGKELAVRFDRGPSECAVQTDPFLLGPLLSLVVARTRAAGIESLVVRTRSVPHPHYIVEAAQPEDASFPLLTMRVLPWVLHSEDVAVRIAGTLGAKLYLGTSRATIDLAAAPG